jgi:DNA-nicking Smr family endonuclease
MDKKKRREKPAAVDRFRANHFTVLKGMDISWKEPDAVPQPPASEVEPVEEGSELFLRAVAGVKALHTEQHGGRLSDGRDRPAPAGGGEAELFRRAMAGVKSLDVPQGGAAQVKRTGAVPRESARSSSVESSGDDREATELFLQEIGHLKLEKKFADSVPVDDELKPLSGNRLRQVKRGVIAVSHQLDLHGLTKEEALEAMPRFLDSARRRGQKAALVITGKGINSPGEPVLQQAIASWLRDAGRGMVLEFAPAPRELGGSGAYVVFLRPLPESSVADWAEDAE